MSVYFDYFYLNIVISYNHKVKIFDRVTWLAGMLPVLLEERAHWVCSRENKVFLTQITPFVYPQTIVKQCINR